MMLDKDLENIFNQKKQRLDRKVLKNGEVKEKIIEGFETASLSDFKNWFNQSNYYKGCYYCQTSSEKSLVLYQKALAGERYNWTRGGKRGKRLELDRKDPSKKYDELSNLVWCCYWCNNAKTNFFTESEFMPIAKAIGNALKLVK